MKKIDSSTNHCLHVWKKFKDEKPPTNTLILVNFQHFHTKGRRTYSCKLINDELRTSDDNSRVAYEWTETHWMYQPEDPT